MDVEPNKYFLVTSEELVAVYQARAAYHEQRAKDKLEKLPGLKETLETLKVDPVLRASNIKNSSYNADPDDFVESAEGDIREHKRKAAHAKWCAEHVVPGKTFELTLADVQLLELGR